MATTADIVQRVADRHVNRLTNALEAALRVAGSRISESALAAALAAGAAGRERAIEMVLEAIEDADLRTLAAKQQTTVWLLDVAEDSANATRCAVRPTTTAAEQALRHRTVANAATQVAAEASERAARALIGPNTVQVTDDIQRAIETTPIRRLNEFVPPPTLVRQALEEAGRVAQFDATEFTVRQMRIADLRPTQALVADSELVVRYRTNSPVPPIVVNEHGAIIDGHRRAASAWAAGADTIYSVQVKSDEVGTLMEWLRWNN